ncbi:MAG: hypothetical protein K8U57_32885 [Planctomycetes bacterium]|nr:hypothetical protein [Planctomycetota bacterium]
MRPTTLILGIAVLIVLVGEHESQAQRGGRGGGGRAGGGISGGARVSGGAHVGAYGGAGAGARSSHTVVGPGGGSRTAGAGGGSYTTQRGTTINYGGAGRGGTTAGGMNYGRGVGGVQVTTPGGRTATKVGTAGGIAGPGGNAIGGRSGVVAGSGPGGSYSGAYRGGVAVGPHGAVAGGTRVGTATGVGGRTVSGASRVGAAAGPYGAVAGGSRVGYGVGPGGVAVGGSRVVAGRTGYGTYYAGRGALVATGGAVRTNFGYYNTFNRGWYAQYPGAWYAAGWTAARIWGAPAWGAVASYCSYPAEPAYYDYGESVVYSGNTVTLNGETEVPAEQYAQQATDIAATGTPTKEDPKPDDFELLGVFAMVQEGEEKSTNIFQLAVSKGGLIRGNYYNALTDTTEPVCGSVDKKTQRAAWTVADRKSPVYEAGIANLTRDEITMLVHFSKDNRQQYMLVRIQQPEGNQPTGKSQ